MTERTGLAPMSDGARIAWSIEGAEDNPVLMLSNSLGTDRSMWQAQLPALTRRFRVLRYDTRGHGQSTVTPGDYGLDRLGRDVVDLLDSLSLGAVDFCGLSLGGMTGQWLGVFAPEKIRRLVLANTSAFMGPASGWQQRIDLVRREGMVAIADAVLARWFTPTFLQASSATAKPVLDGLLATDAGGYSGCCAAIRDMDLRPLARLIDLPALIIGGREDPATPPQHAQWLCDHINDARLVTLAASHLSNLERPEEFSAAVLSFFA